MKPINRIGAQGDVLFRRARLGKGARKVKSEGRVVLAHSETGHHHATDDTGVVYYESPDPLVGYLQVTGEYADVVHHRPWDTHETIRLPKGTWEVRRQREYVPEGWRRVED